MAEIKNSFQGSKMNQDLDDRLIPNGSYRSGTNIQVSNSESDDVGTLQTVLGNFEITDFGISSDIVGLEIIGQAVDFANDTIIVFITNVSASDSVLGSDQTGTITLPDDTTVSNVTKTTGSHFICMYSPKFTGILVQGSFLGFSKLFPIRANIIEDLMFFTDNLNQPRKINIKSAASDTTYYTTEDQISVAKYFPYQTISFIATPFGYKKLGLTDKQSKYLPSSFAAKGIIYTVGNDLLILKNALSGDLVDVKAYMQTVSDAGNNNSNLGLSAATTTSGAQKRIRVVNLSSQGSEDAYVRELNIDSTTPPNCEIKLETESGAAIIDIATDRPNWTTGDLFGFSYPNPDYDPSFSNSGQSRYLEDKFVKFSYRYRFDDGEYSLMAPFTQAAFIPKQFGYLIGEDAKRIARKGIVETMENSVTNATLTIPIPTTSVDNLITDLKVKEIQIVSKASNDQNIKVITDLKTETFAGGVDGANLTGTGASAGTGYDPGVYEVSPIGGSGSGLIVKVRRTGTTGGDDDDDDSQGGSGGTSDTGPLDTNYVKIVNGGRGYTIGDIVEIKIGSVQTAKLLITSLENYLTYNYNSQQPIKVLPEKEVTRVSDIVPIKALAQTIVGNRVVYGNFLQKHGNLEKLDYSVEISDKKVLSATDQQIKEHPNHTIKQGRTYQIGVVLRDKYGRLSNVMLNDDTDEKSSTIYVPYTFGGSDPLQYFGRTLRIKWNSQIPEEGSEDWPGLYHATNNPLGWYSYQIVVKQKEQEYYNVYTPGSLSGSIVFKGLGDHANLQFESGGSSAHITLTGDNINKVPRELKSVGGNDTQFGSETTLFCVVGEPRIAAGNASAPADTREIFTSQQMFSPERIIVQEIKTFRDLGDWTIYKGVNLKYLDGTNSDGQFGNDTFIYPGQNGSKDPLHLGSNKNPYVAKLSTKTRLGLTTAQQTTVASGTAEPKFSYNLHVFETAPTESALEIFYETCTTGLISELNNSIRTAEPTGVLTGISPVVFNLQEGDAANTTCTNSFEVMTGSNATNKINNPFSSITIHQVTDGTGTNVKHRFEIFQASAGSSGTSPTFAIRSKHRFIFTENSFDGDCKISFILKATCPDSEGTQISRFFNVDNCRVTNKTPILYRLTQETNTTGKSKFNQAYHNSNNYIDHTHNIIQSQATIPTQPWVNHGINGTHFDINTTGGTAYSDTQNGMYVEREELNKYVDGFFTQIFSVNLANIDFITNGYETISSFTQANSYVSSIQPRHVGLKAKIKKVTRWSVAFGYKQGTNDVEKYYFPQYNFYNTYINAGVDKTFEFQLQELGNGNQVVRWAPPSFTKVKKSHLGNNPSGDFKAAWLYAIELQLLDSSDGSGGGGAGSRESSTFNFHYIIHR
jgi:hypothetical protein